MLDYQKLINSLPREKTILGIDDYFHAVVFIPLIKIEGEYHLLFQRRAPHIRQGDEISFPGGGFDQKSDRTITDTAIRETCEELGISPEHLSCDAVLGTILAPMGALVDITIGMIHCSTSSFKINTNEVASIFTIPVDYFIKTRAKKFFVRLYVHPEPLGPDDNSLIFPAKQLGIPKRYHQPWGGKQHRVYVYETEFGTIWGLTAQIIQELLKYLKH